jgi:hypothetical protein
MPKSYTQWLRGAGSESLSYDDCARLLSAELGRSIRYERPWIVAYVRQLRRQGVPLGLALMSVLIYTTVRLGKAGTVYPDLAQLLQRAPRTFAEFARDYRAVWLPGGRAVAAE